MTIAAEPLAHFYDPRFGYLERNGRREEVIAGRHRYVGRDDKMRAIVGPVRHRAKKWFSFGKKEAVDQDRTIEMKIGRTNVNRLPTMTFQTIDFSNLASGLKFDQTTLSAPPQEPIVRERISNWFIERWYDPEWHRGARNTAGTVLMWSFTVVAVATFLKGALWILSL